MIAKHKVKAQMRKVKIKRFVDLAEELGVSKQTVSTWFAGGPFASTNLDRLVSVLGCTPNDVLAWGAEEKRLRARIERRAPSAEDDEADATTA
jgi:DNA-binding Xre family transcriptional regulator